MKINEPKKRGPFADPLEPLVSNQKRVELEEIRLDPEPDLPASGKSERPERAATGFTDLPLEEAAPRPAGGMVLTSADHVDSEEVTARWKFWKRPKRRDAQLEVLKEGCTEMVGIMRSMKQDLELSREEHVGVKTSLSPLPVAVASLRSLSKTQEKTGEILAELKVCAEQSAERENNVAASLGNFNETMSTVGRTFVGLEKRSERSIDALQGLSKRIEESDKLHKAMFERLRESEHEFSEQMGRASQRGAFAMVSACGLLSLAIIFMTVSLNQAKYAMEFSNMPSPVELAAAQLRAAEAEAIKSNDEDELGPEPLTPAP